MAAELLGSKWSKMADLSVADATLLAKTTSEVPGVGSLNNTMGHFCHFAMDGGTDADYTHHFDFPILGDFMIVVNPTKVNTDAATTVDLSVQGSVDGSSWVDLHNNIIADGDGTFDTATLTAVYDADAKGIMPFMRLELTAATPSDSTILLSIIPLHKAK